MNNHINEHRDNILSIIHTSVYTTFMGNLIRTNGHVNKKTILNQDLIVTIDVTNVYLEIVNFIMKYKNIPCEKNGSSIIYRNNNALDLLNSVYHNSDARDRDQEKYQEYLKWLCNSIILPVCKFYKTADEAVIPFKERISDVGFDITAISKVKDINSNTVMLDTGIIVSPALGYFTKIYPRSSLVKSGYMLSNSVGIIDATFRDSLKICLVKVNPDAPEIVFPFKCCQLIFEKQIHVSMEEVHSLDEFEDTVRATGGFGSTG